MNIKISYESEFEELLENLKEKYGEKIFELEGIGDKQLDLNRNAKSFLKNSKATADVSVDANANVETKDVIGYQFELPKPLFRLNSLYLLWQRLKKLEGLEAANDIIEEQISGGIYINDFSDVGRPYCFNYSTYDIVLEGLPMITKITSVAPKYLYSFKSQVEQFIVVASNSTLGATGLADLFICMGLYVDKIFKWVDEHPLVEVESTVYFDGNICVGNSEEDVWNYVKETIVSLIYTLNQPMRGNQSPFTNVSVYDDNFLKELCPSYTLEGTPVNPETVKEIQKIYVETMNEELRRTPITFPVTTACFAVDDEGIIQDQEFKEFIASQSTEWGFINFYSGKTSTLSSCCRLRSETDNEYFNSFGSGSTKIGSLGVVTLNLPRLASMASDLEDFKELLKIQAYKANSINNAKRVILAKRIARDNMPLYTCGHMDLSKQYSTIGVTGLYETVTLLGGDMMEPEMALEIIKVLNDACDVGQSVYKAPHNLEQVPAESSSVKLAEKDWYLGYNIDEEGYQEFPYYSNQFIPLTAPADMLDRIKLQGVFDSEFSGGAICHINIEERIEDSDRIEELIDHCSKEGVVYWAINYNIQRCTEGHMSVSKDANCSCGAPIQDNYTRVVGFLTNTKNWNPVRRRIDYPNRVFYK